MFSAARYIRALAWVSRAAPPCGAIAALLSAASCVPATVGKVAALSSAPIAPPAPALPLVATSPAELLPLAPAEAAARNAALPLAPETGPAASAFRLAGTALDEQRSLDCLATAIYYEAASESDDGQRAVAQVVLNRVRHPSYPASVCGVVYQGSERTTGCQFSFTCDGALARRPSVAGWTRARRIAADALAGRVFGPVGLATHYHTNAVLPVWAPRLAKVAVLGAHIFYRMPGTLGAARTFAQVYRGAEPLAARASSPKLAAPALAFAELAEPLPTAAAAPVIVAENALPPSTVREEFAHSGRVRAEFLDKTRATSAE